jgi:hypothetical protein
MKVKRIEMRCFRSILSLLFLIFSEGIFAQPISNKLDISLLFGSVTPFGKTVNQIDGIRVPTHFTSAEGNQSQALRVSYNYNKLLSFGLNIGQFKLENTKLKTSPETFDLIEISPVFTVKRQLFTPLLEARLNLMPLLSSCKSSIYAGDIAYKNSKSEENWIKTSQFVPGMKTSIGLSCRIKDSFGVMVEGGAAFFSDNQKLTSETTNFYYFAQIGISYSLFYNKRFYLNHE